MVAEKARQRVLITTDAVGGVWNYSLTLARLLSAGNMDLIVVAVGPAPSRDQITAMCSMPGLEFFHRPLPLEWMRPSADEVSQSAEWMLNLEAALRPDIIHLNSYLYAAFSWRAPALVVAHSCVCSWWQAVHGRPAPSEWDEYRARVTAGLRAARMVVAPSAAMLSAIRSNYAWRGRAIVIANTTDGQSSSRSAKANYIAAIGRAWDAAKNLSLLDAVASDLPWPILLAGECRFQHQRFSGPNLSLLGQLDPARVGALLQRSPIYAHPAKYEPFGLSVLEAATAGNALVLSDIASLREHWDGAALFADPDVPKEWSFKLRRLIADSALRDDYQERARQRARRFSADRMAAAYTRIYHELAQNDAPEISSIS